MYTATGLFSGIGGFELALSWAGFDVLNMVEIDEWCKGVLRRNIPRYWPNARIHTDVTKITASELGATDLICGGFPCQDVSIASGRKRKGIAKNTRSGLWIEYARLISELRPRVVLLENVPGILTKDGVRVIADLTALGYDSEWGIISAEAVGASHKRERWFCMAYDHHDGQITSPHAGVNDSPFRHIQTGAQATKQLTGCSTPEFVAFSSGGGLTWNNGGQSEIISQISNEYKREGATQSLLGIATSIISRRLVWRTPALPGEQQHEWEAPRTTTLKIKDRENMLKALGNALVPAQAYPLCIAARVLLDYRYR